MVSLVVVVIFNNNSLVTEGGGVLLKQLPSQVKWSWKRSSKAQQGGARDFGGEGLLGGGREENVAPEGLFVFFCLRRRSIVSLVVTLTFSSLCQFGF